jgi:hypothetical protein
LRFLFEIVLQLFGDVVDGVLVIFIERANQGIINLLAVLELIVDERYVNGEVHQDVEVAA